MDIQSWTIDLLVEASKGCGSYKLEIPNFQRR